MNFSRRLSILIASAAIVCAAIATATYCYKTFVLERYEYKFNGVHDSIPVKIDKLTGKMYHFVRKNPGRYQLHNCLPYDDNSRSGCKWILWESEEESTEMN